MQPIQHHSFLKPSTMQNLTLLLIVALALASARPGDPNQQPKPGNAQRETKWKIEDPGILNLQHREKIFENSDHRLDGTALLKKDLLIKQNPTQIGGRLDYNYKPASTNVGVEALNAGRFGTQVGVEATRNLFKGRNSAVDVGANYNQKFGGLGGRSEPYFGGFVRATW